MKCLKCRTVGHFIKYNKQSSKASQPQMSYFQQKNFPNNESFQPLNNFFSGSRKSMKQHLNFQEIPHPLKGEFGMTALIRDRDFYVISHPLGDRGILAIENPQNPYMPIGIKSRLRVKPAKTNDPNVPPCDILQKLIKATIKTFSHQTPKSEYEFFSTLDGTFHLFYAILTIKRLWNAY